MKINDKTCINCKKKLKISKNGEKLIGAKCKYCLYKNNTSQYEIARRYVFSPIKVYYVWIHFPELNCRVRFHIEDTTLKQVYIYGNNDEETPEYATINNFPIYDLTDRKTLANKIKTYLTFR